MAFARKVTGDTGSQEVAQLSRTVNTLVLMLENAAASITAGASAEDVLNAWSAGIIAGTDDNPGAIANVVSTSREVVGLKTEPSQPTFPKRALVSMDSDSNF